MGPAGRNGFGRIRPAVGGKEAVGREVRSGMFLKPEFGAVGGDVVRKGVAPSC
mgnify:CR=1 FL=1